ncbi:PEP-CTERM motif protein [Lacunisphaera limnophila]|uniref:PEP-CTERM motif protein n=1 Tax=Lacunisphaera limnophila TaxID=1838286 RepID=A0A1D8AVD3_9BACT|nr:PEP-CTERM sorting domain-containing protein [Lacunisphaera limnophila]AOS44815.1 PEP-CTERM motif protein [Lacunisphaera limnophila]
MKARLLGIISFVSLVISLPAPPVTQTFTWSSTTFDVFNPGSLSTPGNWVGAVAPSLNSLLDSDPNTNESLIFPLGSRQWVYASGQAYGLTFTGHYHFTGGESTFKIGGGGLTYTGSSGDHLAFDGWLNVYLYADQTWNIGPDVSVEFRENTYFGGTGNLTKTGAGRLDPTPDNTYATWSGNVQFNQGTIVLRPHREGLNTYVSGSLGSGTVTVGPDNAARPTFEVLDWAYNSDSDDVVTIANDFTLNGVFAAKNKAELVLTGDITLNADTTFRTAGENTYVEGAISGAHKLTVNSTNGLVLFGGSNWTGGTEVTKGVLIFGGMGNAPGSPGSVTVGPDGYVGVGVDAVASSAAFVSLITPSSTGTIGFDSDVQASVDTFDNSTIDVSGLGTGLRIGSATAAILGSNITITPKNNNYLFGGGGGWLQVDSALASSGSTVTLDSPALLPLTVRFTNTGNAFTGITVGNSGAIFADDALPGSAILTVNSGAYLGSEDPDVITDATAINTHLARFGSATPGIIGFDGATGAESIRAISLTGVNLGSLTGGGYLGTASAIYDLNGDISGPGVRFTGTIAANADGKHRFAAYKGGALEVAGTLTGNALIIGHPDSLGAFGDRTRGEFSTVLVSGNNAGGLAGGTTFYGGQLIVGQAAGDGTIGIDHTHALGEGALTIAPVTYSLEEIDGNETPAPFVSAVAPNLIISNAIVLNAPETELGGDHSFALTGAITGPGGLDVGEESDQYFVLRLTGNNTYSGGTRLSHAVTLMADSNSALGTGRLNFDNSGGGAGTVKFSTDAPIVYGIASESNDAEIELTSSNSPRLRIIQNFDSTYAGDLRADSGAPGVNGVFVKEGTGTLRLQDTTVYSYGQGANFNVLEAKEGTLVLDNVGFETSTVSLKINGGTLAFEGNSMVYNPIDVVSGRLAGFGAFSSNISIGTGAILSPGLANASQVGLLNFEHLELNSGGAYEWQIQDPTATSGGHDLIHVSTPTTLVVNATNATPSTKFTLKIISLNLAGVNGGALTGIDPNHGLYAWTLFSFDSLSIPGNADVFDPSAFTLDTSLFTANGFTGNDAGTFSVFRQSNQIMLGFTPVPEPSTYLLMLCGLSLVGLGYRRRSIRSHRRT